MLQPGGGSNEYSHQIQYSVETERSGNTRGSGMVDTRLNGSGNYQTRQVGNDYSARVSKWFTYYDCNLVTRITKG